MQFKWLYVSWVLILLASCSTLPDQVSVHTGVNGSSQHNEVHQRKHRHQINQGEFVEVRIHALPLGNKQFELAIDLSHSDVTALLSAEDQLGNAFHKHPMPMKKGLNRLVEQIPENSDQLVLRVTNNKESPLTVTIKSVLLPEPNQQTFVTHIEAQPLQKFTEHMPTLLVENAAEVELLIQLWGLSKYSERPLLRQTMGQSIDNQLIQLIQDWQTFSGNIDQFIIQQLAPLTDQELNHPPKTDYASARPLNWLQSPLLVNARQQIEFRLNNNRIGGPYASFYFFAKPTNEISYPIENRAEFNLVMLARAWAALNYLSPNVMLAPKRFNNYLSETLREGELVAGNQEIRRLLERLGAAFQDGHIRLIEQFDRDSFCSLPINVRYLDGQLFVAGMRNTESIPKWLSIGTTIETIYGTPIDEQYMQTAQYPASNSTYSEYMNALRSVFRVPCNKPVTVEFSVDGHRHQQTWRPKKESAYDYYGITFVKTTKPVFPDSVGFIYATRSSPASELDQAFSKNTVIIDLRSYPSMENFFELPKRILGTHQYGYDLTLLDRNHWGELAFAAFNDKVFVSEHQPYQGNVLVLVNLNTGSRAEALALTLQQSERVTVIGGTTQALGATASYLPLWQGMQYRFTGEGMLDKQGNWLHQRGVVIDEFVVPSKADYLAGRDVELERALDLIQAASGL